MTIRLVFPLVYIVRKFEKEKEDKTMMYYAVYRNHTKYCVVESRERAENIKRELIKRANDYQNKTNCFVNLSVTIREIEYQPF